MENTSMNESPQSAKCPAVSLIIPAYNTEKYIAECLDSVLAQTFKDFEAICIDDGSTDKTLSIFEEYAKRDPRIRVMHQNDLGLVATRNNAIAVAHGEYIFPLDGDDKISPDCLEVLHGFITANDYALVGPSVWFFGDLKKGKIYRDAKKPTKWRTKWNLLCMEGGLASSAAMYPKRLWEKYGGYDHLFDKGMEDLDFYLNFIEDGQKVICLPNRLVYYRQKTSEGSLRAKSKRKEVHKELRANLRRKHPRLVKYRILHKIINPLRKLLRFFICWGWPNGVLTVQVCKFTVYRRRAT